MRRLLAVAAVALHPLAMDALDPSNHGLAKLRCNLLKNALANIRQELLLAPILISQIVDARDALRVAPQVVVVVTQPPPMPPSTEPLTAALSKLSSAATQWVAQASSSKDD